LFFFYFLLMKVTIKHHHIERKRAAVDVFREVKRLRAQHGVNWLSPLPLASVAAGGASTASIYEWLHSNLSIDSEMANEERRGRPHAFSEEQERLLVGFACSRRYSLKPVSLHILQSFCDSYLKVKPALSTLHHVMAEHGFTSQRTLSRTSRMVTAEVVEDALSSIEEIRSYGFPPHRIICMDETGLWSNLLKPKTYHFQNW
jgi:hypothetical protein